jgi:putative chitinase
MLLLNRKLFFDQIKKQLFSRTLDQLQVDGITAKLEEFSDRGLEDLRWLAYILATSYHETGRRMTPVREGFANTDAAARHIVRNHIYGHVDAETHQVYYGRGDVQLTWRKNYDRMGNLLHIPLSTHPDLALQPAISAKILFEGMVGGLFTGKKLSDYFNEKRTDWTNARRIVNALDRAAMIGGYGIQFLSALMNAGAVATKETVK